MEKLLHRAQELLSKSKKKLLRFSLSKKLDSFKQEEQKKLEKKMPMPKKEAKETVIIQLSMSSVAKATFTIIGILLLVYFAYSIQSIVVLLFVALILAAAINPWIDIGQRYHLKRGLSVFIIYFIFLSLFGLVVYSLVPIITEQIITLTHNIGKIVTNILSGKSLDFPFSKELKPFFESFIVNIDKQQIISEVQNVLSSISGPLANIAGNSLVALGIIFNGIFNTILVLVLTYFMVVDKQSIHTFIHSLIPSRYASYYSHKTEQMQEKIGGWVRGQMILCLCIGIATYAGLWIMAFFDMDIPYKETLAVIAGMTEIIPYLGPFLGAVPAALIALNVSWIAVVWIIVMYTIIQQLENNVLVNVIMNKEVGLNPIIIMVAMLIGAQFFGILGILLAIPVATSISVFVEDLIEKEK